MTHAEVCPICGGIGRIPINYPSIFPLEETKPCHGCGTRGWVEVQDNYITPWPYIPIPSPWNPDTTDGNDDYDPYVWYSTCCITINTDRKSKEVEE